jgi:hypothetical protein
MNLHIPRAPNGVDIEIEKFYSDPKSRDKIIKTKDGRVFGLNCSINLSSEYGTNESTRRAYCRFAGIKFADLKAAIKKQREKDKKHRKDREVNGLRELAMRHGYRLVKIKPATQDPPK